MNAAIVTVEVDQPQILIVKPTGPTPVNSHNIWDGLPYGPFSPATHRTLESGLRDWVSDQTGLDLGYAEQLYTFGDRGRSKNESDSDANHVVSIGYLALTRENEEQHMTSGFWRNWYSYLPWEDWRDGRPEILDTDILPRLVDWLTYAETHHGPLRAKEARERVRICFGHEGGEWDEEKVLERYELLYEAGLVAEAERDKGIPLEDHQRIQLGQAMRHDHRRILATAMGRLRGKIKYRPVVFELMHDEFTLFELQKTVEAILGSHLHKQNFRRLVENAGLVEPTGELRTHTGGRPAKLYRFRKDVLHERPAPGVRVKPGRAV